MEKILNVASEKLLLAFVDISQTLNDERNKLKASLKKNLYIHLSGFLLLVVIDFFVQSRFAPIIFLVYILFGYFGHLIYENSKDLKIKKDQYLINGISGIINTPNFLTKVQLLDTFFNYIKTSNTKYEFTFLIKNYLLSVFDRFDLQQKKEMADKCNSLFPNATKYLEIDSYIV